MTIADRARAAAMNFEGKKDALVQRQDGHWKISFTVASDDMPQAIAMAPMGTRYVVALVAIDGNEQPVAPAEQKPKPKNELASERSRTAYATSDGMSKARTRASLLCKDSAFQNWILERSPNWGFPTDCNTVEETAAYLLRKCIGIDSRSQIGTEQAAYTAFIRLESDWRESQGQMAERRG